MPRLIDANKMREDWLENGENEYVYDTNAVLESIDAQPTVDAEVVVRCFECEFAYHHPQGFVYCQRDGRTSFEMMFNNDDFCSYGKRKDGDG